MCFALAVRLSGSFTRAKLPHSVSNVTVPVTPPVLRSRDAQTEGLACPWAGHRGAGPPRRPCERARGFSALYGLLTVCDIDCFGVQPLDEMFNTFLFVTLLLCSMKMETQKKLKLYDWVGGMKPVLFIACIFSSLSCVAAVCPHCGDSIERGTHCGADGSTCPLHTGITHNVALLATGDLTGSFKTTHLLPRELNHYFSKAVQDQIFGIYTAPRDGGSVDLSGTAYATPRAVTQAYVNGHCSYDEALMELGDRLQAC